jgi:hypothetical protein
MEYFIFNHSKFQTRSDCMERVRVDCEWVFVRKTGNRLVIMMEMRGGAAQTQGAGFEIMKKNIGE